MLESVTISEHIDDDVLNSNSKFRVFASCDGVYFEKHASYFLASIHYNSPGLKIVLEIINPFDGYQEKIDYLKSRLNGISLSFIIKYVDLDNYDINQKSAYYSSHRFITLNNILSKDPVPTLMLDIDSYIRKPLYLLFNLYRDIDIALHTRLKKRSISRKVMAGSVFFNMFPNSPSLDLLALVAKNISKTKPFWYMDQEALFYGLETLSNSLRIAHLEKQFIDFDFDNNSFIWTGKGNRKDTDYCYISNSKSIILSLDNGDNPIATFDEINGLNINEVTNIIYRNVSKRNKSLNSKDICDVGVIFNESHTNDINRLISGKKILPLNPSFIKKDSHKNILVNYPFLYEILRKYSFLKKKLIGLFTPYLSASYFEGKTVAIVGNGKSILNKNYGHDIDKHDIVIRFNLGYPLTLSKNFSKKDVPSEFIGNVFNDMRVSPSEEHVLLKETTPLSLLQKYTNINNIGKKTDIWVCATVDKDRQRKYKPFFKGSIFLWPHCDTYYNITFSLLSWNLRILPKRTFNYFKKQGIIPSSGLLLFYFIRKFTKVDALSLYGFDFFEHGHQIRNNTLLLKKQGRFPHNSEFEKQYILKELDKYNDFRIF